MVHLAYRKDLLVVLSYLPIIFYLVAAANWGKLIGW